MFRIAVSSRALFNIEDGNKVFEAEGWDAFDAYMRKNEKKPLRPGVAFSLVNKLLRLNTPELDRVEVILLSSNRLEAGARVLNSVRHYGLGIDRAFFTSGADRFKLAQAGNVTLFLSTNPEAVAQAMTLGIASARIMPNSRVGENSDHVHIAFDGDSVLFSDDSDRITREQGLSAFKEHEQRNARFPLGDGPFKPVLAALHDIQVSFRASGQRCPLRVALVTARGVASFERVLKTFRRWDVNVDESYFCGGAPKGPFLEAFGADLFFDDTLANIESAVNYVPTGHVPQRAVDPA